MSSSLVDANCNIILPDNSHNAALLQQYTCLYNNLTSSFIPAADTIRASIIERAEKITNLQDAIMKGYVDDTSQQPISGWTSSAIAFVVLWVFFLLFLICSGIIITKYLGGGFKNIILVCLSAFMILGVFVAILQKLV